MNIIIFDDECVFCNKMLLWIDNRDTKNKFRYASFENIDCIIDLYQIHFIQKNKQSIIFINNSQVFYKSKAIKKILIELMPTNFFVKMFQYFPNIIINIGYYCIAKNRYQLFGRQKSCQLNHQLSNKMITN